MEESGVTEHEDGKKGENVMKICQEEEVERRDLLLIKLCRDSGEPDIQSILAPEVTNTHK